MNNSKTPEKVNEPAICPKCGEAFCCSPSGKCWCYEVLIPPDKLNELNDTYNSCLCKDCLMALSKPEQD
nr:cysteine-rich CWC family protein [Bacteroidota bacterium]